MEDLAYLVRAAQQGDLEAFSLLVDRFQKLAFVRAYSLLADPHLAEDAAQEAFIEAFLSLPQLREAAAFPGWFKRIIYKHADRLLRSRPSSPPGLEEASELPASGTATDPAYLSEKVELQTLVHTAIEALPENERVVTVLFYQNDYSLVELTRLLGLPLSTVKKRLYTARQRLKVRLLATGGAKDYLGTPAAPQESLASKVKFLLAVRTGDRATVTRLLSCYPQLANACEDWDEEQAVRFYLPSASRLSALHRAVINADEAVVELLLHSGADPDLTFPLHTAVQHAHFQMVSDLLAAGASVNLTVPNGQTPLHHAVIRNHLAIATLLVEKGAEPNLTDENGRTPLHWAALKGYTCLVRLLIDVGASPDLKDVTGRTPLDWAISNGHSKLFETPGLKC